MDDVQLPACNLGNELISITLVIFSVEDFGSLGMGNPFVETGEASPVSTKGLPIPRDPKSSTEKITSVMEISSFPRLQAGS